MRSKVCLRRWAVWAVSCPQPATDFQSRLGERGRAPKGGRHSTIFVIQSSVKSLLVKCPSGQWQPDGLTIRANKWFLGARFLGAPPISRSLYVLFMHIPRKPESFTFLGKPTFYAHSPIAYIISIYIYIYVYISY